MIFGDAATDIASILTGTVGNITAPFVAPAPAKSNVPWAFIAVAGGIAAFFLLKRK